MSAIIELLKVIPWWPLTVLVIAILFRFEIRRAFGRLSQLKYKEFEATFKEELREAEREAKSVEMPQPKEVKSLPSPRPTVTKFDELMRIAEVSPRAAIVEAWREVEIATREAADRHKIIVDYNVSVSKVMHELISKGLLPQNYQKIFDRLRQLRVQAVHAPDFVLGLAETEQFIELALGMAEILRST